MTFPKLEQDTIKFLTFLTGLALVFVLAWNSPLQPYLDREHLRNALETIALKPWAPIVFIAGAWLGLAFGLPLTLFTLTGGMVFGVWPGFLYNWFGALAGSTSAFLIARYLGRGFVSKLLSKHLKKVKELDDAITLNGFLAIFSMRLIPLIPFNLSNFAAGLTGVRLIHFLSASALSLLPLIFIGTYFSSAVWRGLNEPSARFDMLLATALMVLMALLPLVYHWLFRRAPANTNSRGLG